jgi:hypothetical protein
MAHALRKIRSVSAPEPVEVSEHRLTDQRTRDGKKVSQAYRTLQFGFVAAPILAGADKFFHLMVNWDQYLAPIVPATLGIGAHTFMLIVGVIEIVAGIGVALKPKIFSYVVSAWLLGIIGNLLIQGAYYDIALRDFGLALGAFALGRLSHLFDR